MSYEAEQIAKELTIAAIQHMKFHRKDGTSQEVINQFVADEISKVYSTIYKTVARDAYKQLDKTNESSN